MSKFSFLVKEIHSIVTLKLRKYIIFSLKNEDRIFLYFIHRKRPTKGLLYGHGFLGEIHGLLQDPSIDCLECQLGPHIMGGVSYEENGEIIENNMSVEECNEILTELKKELIISNDMVQLF
ncbi:MAG: hypothetical protein EU533_03545 [Promethearchaeota archaeon]|nr:MAG: hypothetical protein EU533_03545 [Candidatus Lokiarchaeota archaeon]